MKRIPLAIFIVAALFAVSAAQQIKVSPNNVTAYSQGATSVFLTYGGVTNKRPVDACWCGDIVPASPDLGFKCNQATIFGCLPVRYNQSSLSGNSAYTDIMSIPPSVARRAYVDAAKGNEATFFYVRRFASTNGGPDEYVPLTIRLSGNGAAVPFSLTDVKLSWGSVSKPILFIKEDEKLPQPAAEITYTGTGRLKGRWELVRPGDELPSDRDLLTEATLPIEERGLQRRYTELSRFNTYLPPTGKITLPGPEVWRMQSKLEGMYLILLRIESVDDGLADSSLADVGAGPAIVHSGGVAGFALPALRYFVGAGGTVLAAGSRSLALLLPAESALVSLKEPIDFTWSEVDGAAYYRLELEYTSGDVLLSAVVPQGSEFYRAPSWIGEKAQKGGQGPAEIRWKVTAFDERGKTLVETSRRLLRLSIQKTR